MSDRGGRHERNGGGQYDSQGCDRESHKSRNRDRENEKDRNHKRDERNRDRDKEIDHGRSYHHHKDRRERRGRDRDRSDAHDIDHRHYQNYGRDYGGEREQHHRHRSRSRNRSEHKSRSSSPLRSSSRSKRASGFDMEPPATALIAGGSAAGALTGGTSTSPAIFPNVLPLLAPQFTTTAVIPQAMTLQATRHARRVYVGGLPSSANEQTVAIFFSQVMSMIGGNTAGPGDAVVNVYINNEKKFAFVEMRSVEEASNAMALDGIIFEGGPVKVRRPSDYNPSLAATLGPCQPNPNLNLTAVGLVPGSAGGLEGPDRIFVGGLPHYLTESQARQLLETFGTLRGFDLVKDRDTGNSRGYAFCIYQDISVTDVACAALNGLKMGDKTLTVRRANLGAVQQQENALLQLQKQVTQLIHQPGALPTKVVCLTQAVGPDELGDDDEYEDITKDMRIEGGKYGSLVNVIIPRPASTGEMAPGVGKVFLEYEDTEGSAKARLALNGRKFGGNEVVAIFYPESKFAQGEYDG